MKVYLDDQREAPEGWTRTYTARATIALVEAGGVTHLSLDHDLGENIDEVGTGYDVLLWIEEQVATCGQSPPEITVHSANVGARPKMELAIESIRRFVRQK